MTSNTRVYRVLHSSRYEVMIVHIVVSSSVTRQSIIQYPDGFTAEEEEVCM